MLITLLFVYIFVTILHLGDTITSPFAYLTGPLVYNASVSIHPGDYAFRNNATSQYLVFGTNDITNTISLTTDANITIGTQTTWSVILHGDRNYSIHHQALNGNNKCMSIRYNNGTDDAVVMWYVHIYFWKLN